MQITPIVAVWLNRIGIILNFLAGFMLAPELLGIERLRRLEEWSAAQAAAMRQTITGIGLGMLIVALIEIAQSLKARTSEPPTLQDKSIRARIRRLLTPAQLGLKKVGKFIENQEVRVFSFAVGLFGNGIHKLIDKLETPGSIRGALVAGGIACFIIGNALQFIGTFT
jgi:hypothetical protein